MTEAIQAFLEKTFSHEMVVFILSILPISEIRGGMIASKLYGLNGVVGYLLGFVGNMLPIPFILLFLKYIFQWMRRRTALKKVVDWLDRKAEKNSKKLLKYEWLGLYLLVAIPLPGTGAWTGALVANFMNMQIKRSITAITLGVITSGLIMATMLYIIPSIF